MCAIHCKQCWKMRLRNLFDALLIASPFILIYTLA